MKIITAASGFKKAELLTILFILQFESNCYRFDCLIGGSNCQDFYYEAISGGMKFLSSKELAEYFSRT